MMSKPKFKAGDKVYHKVLGHGVVRKTIHENETSEVEFCQHGLITCKNDGLELEKENETVSHPAHYCQGGVECIDALEAATTGLHGIEAVCTANAIKYLWRWKHKNGVEDLKKAIFYINYLINWLEKEGDDIESK